MTDNIEIPAGYHVLPLGSPFVMQFGPLYARHEGSTLVIGVRVQPHHLNLHSNAHGGMLLTLADTALGINLSQSHSPPLPMVTANLSSEFLAPAKLGEWLEAHVEILRVGSRLGFADCRLRVGERLVMRASGTFAVVRGVPATATVPSDG